MLNKEIDGCEISYIANVRYKHTTDSNPQRTFPPIGGGPIRKIRVDFWEIIGEKFYIRHACAKTQKEQPMNKRSEEVKLAEMAWDVEPTFKECLAVAPENIRKLCKRLGVTDFASLVDVQAEDVQDAKGFFVAPEVELQLLFLGYARKVENMKKTALRNFRKTRAASDAKADGRSPFDCADGLKAVM